MDRKGKIEKLIEAEQKKLDIRDRKRVNWQQVQQKRFQSLRTALLEIAESVEAAYLKASITKDSATLEVGREGRGGISWEIEPNYGVRSGADGDPRSFFVKWGFRVEESEQSRDDVHGVLLTLDHRYTFGSERGLVKHLERRIAEKVAHYRYRDSLVSGRSKEPQ